MAKKKATIDIRAKNLRFSVKERSFHLIRYMPSSMNVEADIYENGKKTATQTLPFAQIPKELKKLLNPL
jgi:hypothetical protein